MKDGASQVGMNMKSLMKDQNGDAVMIAAVLLLSLGVALGGRLLIGYGEIQGKEDDMAHMADLEDSMMRMRGSMYTLLESGDTQTTIVNRATLGTYGNPYTTVARSSGKISMDPRPDSFSMRLILRSGGTDTMIDSISGSLTYQGDNYYYVDQEYSFHGGGILLTSYGSDTVSSPPSINIDKGIGNEYSVHIRAYGITGGVRSVTGFESIQLESSMQTYSSDQISIPGGSSLVVSINCRGEQAWKNYFSSYLKGQELVEGTDFNINDPVDWTDPDEYLELEILTLNSLDYRFGNMEVVF